MVSGRFGPTMFSQQKWQRGLCMAVPRLFERLVQSGEFDMVERGLSSREQPRGLVQ